MAKDIVKMAGDKDPAAMYVMAGLLGKSDNRPVVEQVVNEAAELFQKSPEHASVLVQALIDRSKDSGDQHKLLETLGKVAGSPDAKINDALMKVARDELRAGFDRCFKKDGSPDKSFSTSLNSAALGMAHMAKNWEAQDVARLTKRMTPEVAAAMKIASKDVPPALRDSLVNNVLNRVRETKQADGEWVPAFNALAALAPFVQLSQFREMKLFKEVASSSDAQVQLALGRAVLAFVNNGNQEVRQEAADHFVTTGWAQQMSPEVRTELLKYAQGKDVKPEMLGKISEMAYESGIKPPIVHLLRTLGLNEINKEQLEKAITAVGGEAKFRDMLSRIASYDSLPKVMQTLLKEGKTDIGKLLPPDLVPTGSNRGEKIDLKKMIEDLSKGSIPDQYKFLANGDFEKNLKGISDATMKTVAERAGVSPQRLQYELTRQRLAGLTGERAEIKDNVADAKKDARKASLDELCKETKKGHDTSLGWLLLGGAGYFIARANNVSNFEKNQTKMLGNFKGADAEFQKAVGEMRRLQAVLEATDLSRATQDQFRLAADGDRLAADKKLLQMGNEYGLNTLQVLAPHAYSQLTGFGLESWQQGVFNRLYLNGLTAIPQLPQLQAHFGKPEAVSEALKVLTSRHLQKPLDSSDPRAWNSDYRDLQRGSRAMMVHEALRAIDSHPALTNATNASAELMKTWSDLEKLVQAGIEGHRGKDLVDHVRGLISRQENGKEVGLEASIKKIQENIPEVKKVVQELKNELKKCSDPLAKEGLERRIQALEKMVETFSPNSKQMQQFTEMARLVKSGSYDESTFWKMLRDNAVPIVGTIAIAALVVATLGTATPLAVIGGALLIASAGLAFREGYAELSYQMNWTGTGGSQLGDAIRRREHELGQRDSGFLVYDSKSGKFAPGPTFGQVALNYGIQIAADTAMNLALMGFGHLVGKGLRAVTGVDRAVMNAQALNKLLGTAKSSTAAFDEAVAPQVVKALWKRWLVECGNQAGFAIASHGTEDALKHGFKEQNFFTHLAAALIVCAGHQTMVHGMNYGGKGLVPKWFKPNSMEVIAEKGQFMDVMTERLAKMNAEGKASDPNFKPVTMKEVAGGKVEVTIPATEAGGKARVIEISFVKPEVALAQMKAEQRELAEGSKGNEATDTTTTPPGRPHGWEGRRTEVPADRDVEVGGQKLSERATIAREQTDKWVDLTVEGRYAEAAEHALNAGKKMESDGKATIKFIEVEVPAGKINEQINEVLTKMGGQEGGATPGARGNDKHVEITVARPTLVLTDGTKVDLTQLSQSRRTLSDAQRGELDAALNTAGGKALLERMARQQMEEIIAHANRILGGDKPLSATQVRFSQDVASDRPEGPAGKEALAGGGARHKDSLGGKFDARVAEQEVIALLFERGAKWSDIAAIAANTKHGEARSNLLEYLKSAHYKGSGTSPTDVPAISRLPGAPGAREVGEGSGIPRTLLGNEAPKEASPADRGKVDSARTNLTKQIDEAGLPPGVAEALRLMMPREIASETKPQELAKQAKDLALIHDILNVPAEIRAHVLDGAILAGKSPVELARALDTARTCAELVKSGVSLDRIKALPLELLDQLAPQLESVPARIREAFLDPVIQRGYNKGDFESALGRAQELARLTPAGQLEYLSARVATTGGAEQVRNQELLLKTARDVINSKTYETAKGTQPGERNGDEAKLIKAVEQVREALGISKDKWDNVVEPALKRANKPSDITKIVEENVTKLRDVYEPPKPADMNALEPFGVKSREFLEVLNEGKPVRDAAEKADAASRELASREKELNKALEPEIQRLRREHEARLDPRSDAEYREMALAKLATGNGEAGLRTPYERFTQAKTLADQANAQLREAQERLVGRLNTALSNLNKSSTNKQSELSVKLDTHPNAVAGYDSATRTITVTPEVLRGSPEQIGTFLAREVGRARLDYELATALGYSHNPSNRPNPNDIQNLQAEFKTRTGRDLDAMTAREALKTGGRVTKPTDNAQRIAELEAAVKSTKVSEYTAAEQTGNKVRSAAEQVRNGKSNEVIDRVIADAAYAQEVFGHPLPPGVRGIVEQARRGENVDPVTVKKALTEALDSRQVEMNTKMKTAFEGMTPREVAVIGKGQAGGNAVSADVAARPVLVARLAKEFSGAEPWKAQAREMLESTKSMERNEADVVLELLRLRALKESNNTQYETEKGKLGKDMKILLEGFEVAINGGPNVAKPSEVAAPGKTIENLQKLAELNKILSEIAGHKASDKKTLQTELIHKCMRELIGIDPAIVRNNPDVLQKALTTRDDISASLEGRGKAFEGMSRERLLKMREVLDETLREQIGSREPKSYFKRIDESVAAVKGVSELIKAGKTDRAEVLADLIGCSKDFPNPAFPFKALSEAALNDKAPLDVLKGILQKFQDVNNLFPNGVNAQGEANTQLGIMLAMARGVPGYEGWVYVPTGKQSLSDHLNLDGVFINTATGEARPLDFFAKGSTTKVRQSKDFWAKESNGDINGATVLNNEPALNKAQAYIKDFMTTIEANAAATGAKRNPGDTWTGTDHSSKTPVARQNDNAFAMSGSTGLSREFMQEVGLPTFKGSGREGVEVSPKDVAEQTRSLEKYYDKVCAYMQKVYTRDGTIPAHVEQLAESIQNRLAMARASEISVNEYTQRLTGGVPSTAPKWTVDPNTGAAEVKFNADLSTSSTIKDFQGNVLAKGNGYIPGMRVEPDGTVMGVGNGAKSRAYAIGSLSELYQVSIAKQTVACANNPSRDNVQALQRMQSELAFIERELSAGRKLDFNKPPLADVLSRLGGK